MLGRRSGCPIRREDVSHDTYSNRVASFYPVRGFPRLPIDNNMAFFDQLLHLDSRQRSQVISHHLIETLTYFSVANTEFNRLGFQYRIIPRQSLLLIGLL